MSDDQITMPCNVDEAIEEIRQSGQCNMLDFNCVQVRANDLNMYSTVVWMEENKKSWGKAIMSGWTVEECE